MRRWRLLALLVLAFRAVSGGFAVQGADAASGDAVPECLSSVTADIAAASERSPEAAKPQSPRAVLSPLHRLNVADLDLRQTLAQTQRFHIVDRFELPSSGVVVVLHSDGTVAADPAALDEILHARLRHHDAHASQSVQARIRCFKKTIVDERVFAGSVVNIYVPANPAMCIKNVRLVQRPAGTKWHRHCHWKGATPPVRFSGFLGEVRLSEYHMVIAPGITNWSNARPDSALAEIVRHEADHLWDWMMNVSPTDVAHNERRAVRGDAVIDRVYEAHGKALPSPFFYAGR